MSLARDTLLLPLIAVSVPLWVFFVALAWALGMEIRWRTTLGDVCRYLGGKLV